jgi:hypothetical protein
MRKFRKEKLQNGLKYKQQKELCIKEGPSYPYSDTPELTTIRRSLETAETL